MVTNVTMHGVQPPSNNDILNPSHATAWYIHTAYTLP